jgi:hypothetical protein
MAGSGMRRDQVVGKQRKQEDEFMHNRMNIRDLNGVQGENE